MGENRDSEEIILFHWNIVELSDKHAIFVGLRVKSGTTSPYVFRYSTSIKSFDESTGIGITDSGRVYRCQGAPSDPKCEIRTLVSEEGGVGRGAARHRPSA